MNRVIVGITGGSGAILAYKLLKALSQYHVDLVISSAGAVMLKHELGLAPKELLAPHITQHNIGDIAATIASGSYKTKGMVIVPCSMATAAAIACGLSDNLIRRAADVVIKERRPLVIVPREAPLSPIHLENLLKLSQVGAYILPPMPAWYNKPSSLSDMEDAIVGKILESLGISQHLSPEWKGLF